MFVSIEGSLIFDLYFKEFKFSMHSFVYILQLVGFLVHNISYQRV